MAEIKITEADLLRLRDGDVLVIRGIDYEINAGMLMDWFRDQQGINIQVLVTDTKAELSVLRTDDMMTGDDMVAALQALPADADRLAVFGRFCTACGSSDPDCECWR